MNKGQREFIYRAVDEAATERLGELLAECLPDGATLSLNGTLGAGKTRLVQALATACGVDRREVVSPTFMLCQTYHGRRTVHHLDAYRIRDDDEFLELGVHELFGQEALSIVEWGERVAACLPEDTVEVWIEVTGPTEREFRVRLPVSDEFAWVVQRLAEFVG